MDYFDLLHKLETLYNELSKLSPTEISEPSWTGLVGVIQQYRSDSKFSKLCETPVGETNYLNVSGYLLKMAKSFEELFSSSEEITNEKKEKVVSLIGDCYNKWVSIYPAIENATINDEVAPGAALSLGNVTKYNLYETFLNYNLSEPLLSEIKKNYDFEEWKLNRIKEKANQKSSGCLAFIVVLVIINIMIWI